MSRRRSILAIAIVAVVAAAAGAVVSWQRDGTRRAEAAAADLFYRQTLVDANGVPHAMSEQRGKLVVVNFWATWCVPCVQEIPAFSAEHAAHGDRAVFVGLGIDSVENIASFDRRFRPSYPLLAAGATGTDLARAFGDESGALPFTVVLGPDGRVVASHLGQVDAATLRGWIDTGATPAS